MLFWFPFCCRGNTLIKNNIEKEGFIWLLLPGYGTSLRQVMARTQTGP